MTCDDCCDDPCVCDPLWKWITEKVRAGAGLVAFCMTEDGEIGVFLGGVAEDSKSVGVGDTADEAVEMAIGREVRT